MRTASGSDPAETVQVDAIDYLDDPFIDRIWQDLSGQVTYELIRQVVAEETTRFWNAKVPTFIPIFVRQNTREKLVTLVNERGGSSVVKQHWRVPVSLAES